MAKAEDSGKGDSGRSVGSQNALWGAGPSAASEAASKSRYRSEGFG